MVSPRATKRNPPRGNRTPDLLLKRELLYQLSYGRAIVFIPQFHIVLKLERQVKRKEAGAGDQERERSDKKKREKPARACDTLQ